MEIPPARKPRWPFQPLMDASRAQTMKALARRLEVDTRQLYRWRSEGITDLWADRLALRLGLMPAEVWGGWFDIDTSGLDAEEGTMRARADAKRAAERAYDRDYSAWYRAQHPEKVAQFQRAYHSRPDVKDAKRRYNRSYYRRNRDQVLERQRQRDRARAS